MDETTIELDDPWEPVVGMGDNAYAYKHPNGAVLAFGVEKGEEDQYVVKWQGPDSSLNWTRCDSWENVEEILDECLQVFEERGEFPKGEFN